MQLRDTGLAFSPITIALHWLAAALVGAILVLAVMQSTAASASQVDELRQLKTLLAVVLFPLSVYRLWARLTSFHPLPVGTPNPIEVIVSRSVATALVLATVLLPIAAWLELSAAGQAILLPGGYRVPALMAPSEQVAKVVAFLFKLGSTAFLLGLALHIFGALKNHLALRNDTLARMLGKKVEL